MPIIDGIQACRHSPTRAINEPESTSVTSLERVSTVPCDQLPQTRLLTPNLEVLQDMESKKFRPLVLPGPLEPVDPSPASSLACPYERRHLSETQTLIPTTQQRSTSPTRRSRQCTGTSSSPTPQMISLNKPSSHPRNNSSSQSSTLRRSSRTSLSQITDTNATSANESTTVPAQAVKEWFPHAQTVDGSSGGGGLLLLSGYDSTARRHHLQRTPSRVDTLFDARSPRVEASSPVSPRTYIASDAGSDAEPYSTPLTSPDSSPTKPCPSLRHFPVQLDGASSSADCGYQSEDGHLSDELERAPDSIIDDSHHLPRTPNVRSQRADNSFEDLPSSLFLDIPSEGTTPLAPAPPARRSSAFPSPRSIQSSLNPSRRPSVLLTHCERNASPRQRRLMAGGLTSPDRFVPSRAATPTKEALILTHTTKLATFDSLGPTDPFAPAVRRSIRMAERYATLRSPGPAVRSVTTSASRIRDAQSPDARSASTSTTWTVGGLAVTDGVASTTNGRGGRVTSGTSAPHYGADFIRKRSQTDEQVMHGQRLALAMDIRQSGRMVEQVPLPISPSSPVSPILPVTSDGDTPSRVLWKDGKWESPLLKSRLFHSYNAYHFDN